MVRNLLFLLGSKAWKLDKVTIICVRKPTFATSPNCVCFDVFVPQVAEVKKESVKVAGWEKNQKGKSKYRIVNLSGD